MKMTKKKVFVAALAMSLIAIISLGTLAWFTDSDEVKNNFYFATTDDTDETAFDIDVFEQDSTGAITDTGIEYNNILPGDVLVKKAFVKNASTDKTSATINGTTNYSQFVRATVTISAADVIKNNAGTATDEEIVSSMLDFTSAWNLDSCSYDDTAKTFVAVLYAKEIVEPGAVVSLFTQVTIPSWIIVDDANEMNNEFGIDVFAEAVQSDNTGYDNAKEAFENLVD